MIGGRVSELGPEHKKDQPCRGRRKAPRQRSGHEKAGPSEQRSRRDTERRQSPSAGPHRSTRLIHHQMARGASLAETE